jgi:hypothetical protein
MRPKAFDSDPEPPYKDARCMMKRPDRAITLSMVLAVAAARGAEAQGRGGSNWTTVGGDAQRTSWVKTDPLISRENLQKPGSQLLWKTKLENQPRQLESLTQPVLLPNIISYKGFKALAFVGGSSNNVYAIDYDARYRAEFRFVDPCGEVAARHAVRARWPDRRRALLERRTDHVVQPFLWTHRCERARLHRDL